MQVRGPTLCPGAWSGSRWVKCFKAALWHWLSLAGLARGSLDLPVFHTFPKAAPLSVLQARLANQSAAFENSSLGLYVQILLIAALPGASKELSLFSSVRIQANSCWPLHFGHLISMGNGLHRELGPQALYIFSNILLSSLKNIY